MSGTPSRARHGPTRPSEALSDANALVLAEPSPAGGRCPCTREAHDGTALRAEPTGFLRVAFTRADRVPPREWVHAAADAGVRVRVVDATPCPEEGDDDEVVTVAASGPSNLTDLGVRITDALAELDASGGRATDDAAADRTDGGSAGRGPVCCLGSMTALLQYVDTRDVYQFVNAVTARVSTHGGVAHAHLQPELHDRQTVDTVASLFEVVAEPRTDGAGLEVVRSRRR
ncbi:DUF7504 family protein [Halobaculum sp. EA56]|uniref:DUF7504 family protein n=1 Tax=Halobaculum sp. EA56 TaxID=3421648 RepID=UPI003EC09418